MEPRRGTPRPQSQHTHPAPDQHQQYYEWASQQQQQPRQRHPQPQQHPLRQEDPSRFVQQQQQQHRLPHNIQQQQYQQHLQQQQQQQQQRGRMASAGTWVRALPFHQLDAEDCPQGRTEHEITPMILEETTVKCPVQGCGRSLVPDFTQASFGFVLEEDVDKVLTSSKAERKRLLRKFLRMVNALLNQGGGLVFVHTSPNLLNFWDEQVDDNLMEMVPDNTLFDENFERHVVEKHVIFRVKPLRDRPLSTLDFQSKISLNKGLVDPTHGQIRRLLTRPAPKVASCARETLDSITLVEGQRIPFHENLNVQAKVVLPGDLDRKVPKMYTDTASRLMHFWWHNLKLPLYIAAFAKQQNGGSFFVGLREEKEVSTTKWKPLPSSSGVMEALESEMQFWADDKNSEEKKIFHIAKESDVPRIEHKSGYFTCNGISLTQDDKAELKRRLKKNVSEQLLLHPRNNDDKPLVELHFHEVEKGEDDDKDVDELAEEARGASARKSRTGDAQSPRLCVVEARVDYFHGLCFQSKGGPEAYKFDKDHRPTCVRRVPIKQWAEVQVVA